MEAQIYLLAQMEAVLTDALTRKEICAELSLGPSQTVQLIITFTRGLAVMERIYHDPERLKGMSRDFVSLVVKPCKLGKTR